MVTIRTGYVCVTTEPTPTVANSWVTHVEQKFGLDWVTCDRVDARFAKFVNKNFQMMEELQCLRTEKSEQMMKSLEIDAEDPLQKEATESEAGPLPKRARKQMVDEIAGPRG